MLFPRLLQLMACAVQLLLSVFFLFVGGMKTFASMPMLELHHAWVAGLPVAIARSVGISELVCGATMMSGLFIRPFAWWSGVAAWSLVRQSGRGCRFPRHAQRNGGIRLAKRRVGPGPGVHRRMALFSGETDAAMQQKQIYGRD